MTIGASFTHNAYGVPYAPDSLKVCKDVTDAMFAEFRQSRKINAIKILRQHTYDAQAHAVERAPFSQIAIWDGMTYLYLMSNLAEVTAQSNALNDEDAEGSAQFSDYVANYRTELGDYIGRRFTHKTIVVDSLHPAYPTTTEVW